LENLHKLTYQQNLNVGNIHLIMKIRDMSIFWGYRNNVRNM